jgi:hypothetical protein
LGCVNLNNRVYGWFAVRLHNNAENKRSPATSVLSKSRSSNAFSLFHHSLQFATGFSCLDNNRKTNDMNCY